MIVNIFGICKTNTKNADNDDNADANVVSITAFF